MTKQINTLELYQTIANAIAQKYLAEITTQTAIKGERLSFEELMIHLTSIEKELTQKAVSLLEQTNHDQSSKDTDLTEDIHQIIKGTIEDLIKKL